MIPLSLLLIDLVAREKKLVCDLRKKCPVTLLLLRSKAKVIQADIYGCPFEHLIASGLVVRVLVYMAVDLVIVHQLRCAYVREVVAVLRGPKVVGKHLHEHRLAGSRFPDEQDVLMDLVILVRKYSFCQRTAVEIIRQELQYTPVAIVDLKPSILAHHQIVAYTLYQSRVYSVLFGIGQIVLKIVQNSFSVIPCLPLCLLLR